MKVLVVGGGGREHALAWKLAQSPAVREVICQSGNAGMAQVARCEAEPAGGVLEMARWAAAERVDLAVVGPEAYLDLGLVDAFTEHGVPAIGPTRRAAAIESSKSFAKELMARYGVPTAAFAVCDSPAAARAAVRRMGAPVVVKAEGLAAGKGVTVCRTLSEAEAAIARTMEERVFGEAGDRVVIEEFLVGEEASILAFVDGENVLPMVPAQDHKAIGEGDTGPNTGGMGAYSPAPVVTDAVAAEIMAHIIEPTVRAMADEGRPFKGVLYAGLMITGDGPKLLEYNTRFGDPECQVLCVRLKSDLLPALLAARDGVLSTFHLRWRDEAALTVVMAAKGYPGAYRKGTEIRGVEQAAALPDVTIFHAGTKRAEDGRLLAAGGRVLNVTALGRTVAEAQARAYEAVDRIDWPDGFCRRDIGWRAVRT